MNSTTFKVAKFEFLRQIKKPAFWVAILLMPLMMGGVFLIAFIFGQEPDANDLELDENTTIAITDEAGVLSEGAPFVINDDEAAGIEMVKNGEVDLYFYIPKDFAENGKIEFYHISEGLEMFNFDGNAIKAILSQSAAEKFTPVDIMMLTGNFEVVDNKLTTDGEDANALGKAIVPGAILVVFFLFVCLFGNRFLMTVVEEKENRISEMILTSVSAKHLIIGKILALMGLGVIQITSLIAPVLIILVLNHDDSTLNEILSMIEIDPVMICVNIILFIFSIFLFAGACTFVGALVPTAKDASQFIGPVIIGVVFPLYFMQMFLATTPNAMVYFLTYFPLSAPTAMMLRSTLGTLPMYEFIIGLVEIIIISIIVIILAVKTFQKNSISFKIVKPKFLRR